jgi:glycyl-tRNA synthetase beta chain
MPETLLVELLTEELPPKSLRQLSEAFMDKVFNELARGQLIQRDPRDRRIFATPRRLALLIPNVLALGQDRESEVAGPPAKAAPQAIAGFAKKHGVAVEALQKRATEKGDVMVARVHIEGLALEKVLAGMVEEALKALPIPKVMRWGAGEAQFVRPVHWLVMLYGSEVVPATILGLAAGSVEGRLKLTGEAGVVSDYDAMTTAEGRASREVAHAKLVASCRCCADE